MNKDRILLSSIYFLFHAGLMAYKLFHPLWFYEQGKLEYFAVGYAFMALGGILSSLGFIYIKKSFQVTSLLLSSLLLYSLGVIVSSFTSNIWYSIFGGVLTGLSTNNLLYTFYRLTNNKEDSKRIAINAGIVMNFAQFSGVLGVVVITALFCFVSRNLLGIYISSILPILSVLPFIGLIIKNKHFKNMEFVHNDPFSVERIRDLHTAYPYLVYYMMSISFLGGLFMNMLLPFVPVIFKNEGFTLLTTGLIISFSYLAGSILHFVVDKYKLVTNKVASFALSHILIILSCVGLCIFTSTLYLGISMGLYFMMVSLRRYSRVLIENQIIARHIMPSFKSFEGILYYLSTVFGSLLGYNLLNNIGKMCLVFSSGSITFISGALCLFFVYRNMVYMYNLHLQIEAAKRNMEMD